MATEKASNKSDKKAKANGSAADDATGKGDTAAKPMTKEQILALHRAKAAAAEHVTDDVVGNWDSDGEIPITGIFEVGVFAHDSGIDETKPSLLMKCKVTVPTVVIDKDKNENIAKPGDLVGVWYKPGMRPIRSLGGIEVTMSRDPSKDRKTKDKPGFNEMKAFDIRAKGTGMPMRIVEDRREKSVMAKTPFDVKQEPVPASRIPQGSPPAVYGEGDKLPF